MAEPWVSNLNVTAPKESGRSFTSATTSEISETMSLSRLKLCSSLFARESRSSAMKRVGGGGVGGEAAAGLETSAHVEVETAEEAAT